MKSVLLSVALSLAGSASVPALLAQTAAPAPAANNRALGAVTAVDPVAKTVTLKTEAGTEVKVTTQDSTKLMRVPPGEKDLKNAAPISFGDIGVGDRVLARGPVGADQTLPATAVIVMTKADIAKKHEADRAEWQRRGVSGPVTAMNASAKEVTINVRGPGGAKPVVVKLSDSVNFRRYAPDSIRFADAKPGTLADLKVGDQMRVLGAKSEDGAQITAEEVLSGTFRNIPATVLSVDAASKTIRVTDLDTKKPIVVKLSDDSTLKRLPPMAAQMLANQMRGGAPGGAGASAANGDRPMTAGAPGGPGGVAAGQGGPGGFRPGSGGGTRPGAGPAGTPPGDAPAGPNGGFAGRMAGGAGGPGGPGMMGGGGGPRGGDMQGMIDRLPVIQVAELKAGDALIINSTVGADPAKVTAITLLAGVEPILTSAPANRQGGVLANWNLDAGGGGFPQ